MSWGTIGQQDICITTDAQQGGEVRIMWLGFAFRESDRHSPGPHLKTLTFTRTYFR